MDDETVVVRALKLAREIEKLLDQAPTSIRDAASPQAARMAQAMAASLVDELTALARRTTPPSGAV